MNQRPSLHEAMMQFDKTITPLPILGRAIDGALLGAAIGYLAHRKEGSAHKHVGRHALMGAGIGAAVGIVGYIFGKSMLTAGHMMSDVVESPGSPLFHRGHGALPYASPPMYPPMPQTPVPYAQGYW